MQNTDTGIHQTKSIHAVDAEQAVIGCLLLNSNLLADIVSCIKAEHLFDKRHQVIWRYMIQLAEEKHLDPLILTDSLRSAGELKSVGGAEYIAELADIGANPVNLPAYAELIRDKAFLRSMAEVHQHNMSAVFHSEGASASEILDSAESRLEEVSTRFRTGEGGIRSVSEVVDEYEKKIYDNHRDMTALRGYNPGFYDLYRKTHGLHRGDLIILAGRPGAGKTAFGLNLVCNICKRHNVSGLIFSLEMSSEQLVARMLSHHGLDMHHIRSADSIKADTLNALATASAKVRKLNIDIDDSASLNILEARAKARKMKKEIMRKGRKLGVIMVDYLQLMDAPSQKDTTRALEIAKISRGLKALAKELEVPVIALSQLNRLSSQRADNRPVMSDLRDSGAIEQDADLILFLHGKDDEKDREQEIKLIIGKARNAPTGTIDLIFAKSTSTFREKSDYEIQDSI